VDQYAAGLVDGEGYIGIVISGGSPQVRLRVTMTDKGLVALRRMRQEYGGTLAQDRPEAPPRRVSWTWRLVGAAAVGLIRQLQPMLLVKAEAARIALELQDMMDAAPRTRNKRGAQWSPSMRDRADVLIARMHEANRRGPDPVVAGSRPLAVRRVGSWWPADETAEDPTEFRLPLSGVMVNGRIYPAPAAQTEAATVAGLLPTPEAKLSDSGPDYARQGRDGSGGDDLTTAVFRAENTANLPTPTTRDAKGRNQRDDASCLPGAVERMTPSDPDLLPTPRASEGPKGSPNQRGSSGDLMLTSAILQLPEEATPLLPTPDAAVFNDGQTPEAWEARHARELAKGYNGNGGGTPLAGVVQFLPTPEASDATGGRTATELGGTRASGTKRAITLGAALSPRLLPTPVVTDAASSGSRAIGEDSTAHPGTSLTEALVRDERLMATPRVASERTSRHAATSRENRSAPSLAQSVEIAAGILPREFDSWEDLPASLGNGVVPRQAALALRILALWHVAAVSGDASEVDPPSREEVLA
jgi:hypothetical protein